MTRTVLLAMALAVVGMASAFAPVEKFATSSSNHVATATVTFLFPEQGSRLVAFSHDYLSRKAKGSAVGASNLPSPRRRRQDRRTTLMIRNIPNKYNRDMLSAATFTMKHC